MHRTESQKNTLSVLGKIWVPVSQGLEDPRNYWRKEPKTLVGHETGMMGWMYGSVFQLQAPSFIGWIPPSSRLLCACRSLSTVGSTGNITI